MNLDEVKKTQTATVRLDSELIDELKNEAKNEKINFNLLISKILSNHVLWGKYERKAGLLPMTKPFVKAAIHGMTEDEVLHLAKEIEKEAFSDILKFMKGKYTVDDFIEILRTWLNVAWMQHGFEKTKNSYIFKIQHDLGKKWSLYVRTLITALFQDIMKRPLEVKCGKNSIVVVFPLE